MHLLKSQPHVVRALLQVGQGMHDLQLHVVALGLCLEREFSLLGVSVHQRITVFDVNFSGFQGDLVVLLRDLLGLQLERRVLRWIWRLLRLLFGGVAEILAWVFLAQNFAHLGCGVEEVFRLHQTRNLRQLLLLGHEHLVAL